MKERQQSLALMEKLNNEKQDKSELEVFLHYFFKIQWLFEEVMFRRRLLSCAGRWRNCKPSCSVTRLFITG